MNLRRNIVAPAGFSLALILSFSSAIGTVEYPLAIDPQGVAALTVEFSDEEPGCYPPVDQVEAAIFGMVNDYYIDLSCDQMFLAGYTTRKSYQIAAKSSYKASQRVCVLVDSSVYDPLKPWIDVYVTDVEGTGIDAIAMRVENKSAREIREILKGIPDLVGCLLVGDIPAAWYETWMKGTHREFPTDIYYADLDGLWEDKDSDGIFDIHTGNIAPEIWVGRLKPPLSSLSVEECVEEQVNSLRTYFTKNHIYRMGGLSLPYRALLYMDNMREVEEVAEIEAIWENYTFIVDPETNPADYLRRLTEGWNYVIFNSHGSPDTHHFIKYVDDSQVWEGDVDWRDIQTTNPLAFFYEFETCSAGRYTHPHCIAAQYVFSDYGLLATAWTTTRGGGYYPYDELYLSLAKGECFGSAMRQLLEQCISRGDLLCTPNDYYGAVILGDPLLKPLKTGIDSDGDVLTDSYEESINMNPLLWDTDGDGLSDYVEIVRYGSIE